MPDPAQTLLSIVIPAYNEESRLPDTLRRIQAWAIVNDFIVDVLVVDDGSRDGTVSVAERASAGWPAVRILRNPGNRGKGYSVRHGMLHAAGEIVLFSDADLSAPIEEADKLIAPINAGADIAIGSRALNRKLIGVRQTWFRETAGKIFNLMVRLVLFLPFRDTQCGFKAFRRQAAREIAARQQIEGWGFDVEQLFLARKLGYKTVEIPVRWNHAEGTKISMLGDSVRMFTDLLRIRWNSVSGRYHYTSERAPARRT